MSSTERSEILLTRGGPGYPTRLVDRLGEKAPERIALVGSPEHLSVPLTAVFCSRRCPGALILDGHDLAQVWRGTGTPVIGGFQSPMEKECLRVLLKGEGPIVLVLARTLPQRLPPEWRTALDQGRLTSITSFIEGPRRPDARTTRFRNRVVAALAHRIVIIHAEPGGKVEEVCREAVEWGLPVHALDHPDNERLAPWGVEWVNLEALSSVEVSG